MKHVAAALAIRDGQILLARRAPGQSLAGLWEFPGGKQEPNETIQQCIEREIREELSLSCTAGKVLTESVYRYVGGAIKLIGVIVELDKSEPILSVHDCVTWAPIDKVLSFQLAPADIPIAKEVMHVAGPN
ncbi:(deoxy)nucleoside triphosphate pyrophosphohydrolase [Billgrantia pellis]|uniref:8-oxo-dGTP diphosphatase n=1 Tax=Billgrantia pellis TaxID=2606936 RepID=A0A7V7FY44_9GAMM|nr:(deoxy)nucleoside triphosphate pyrophosphohydrolase [Halomonas pellis]